MLQINNLYAKATSTNILNGINLEIPTGQLHVLMGPNGSGKSTLSNVIMGHPNYQVTTGKILLNNTNLLDLEINKRSLAGVFLAFQYPQEIPGVNFSNYMRLVYNAHQSKTRQLPVFKFRKLIKKTAAKLDIPLSLLERNLNEDLSGGEKKKLEILQMALIKPKLAILDETDSGLDLDAIKAVFSNITTLRQTSPEMSMLVITHYQKIFKYITPDRIHIMINGKIKTSGDITIVDQINKNGYKQFQNNMDE